jgi:hypothetical protein
VCRTLVILKGGGVLADRTFKAEVVLPKMGRDLHTLAGGFLEGAGHEVGAAIGQGVEGGEVAIEAGTITQRLGSKELHAATVVNG